MAIVSLGSPSCEVPCLILHSVVYRDITRQAKGLYCLKYVGALKSGLAYLSRCNSGWFCHTPVASQGLRPSLDSARASLAFRPTCRRLEAPDPGVRSIFRAFWFISNMLWTYKMHRKYYRYPKIVKLDLFDSSIIDLRRKIKIEHVKALYN
jgi:hypothetical protein